LVAKLLSRIIKFVCWRSSGLSCRGRSVPQPVASFLTHWALCCLVVGVNVPVSVQGQANTDWPPPPVLAPAQPHVRLRQIRISPSGTYAIAQTESELIVLRVQPFSILFHVPAKQATLAQFTADSKNIVLVTSIAAASNSAASAGMSQLERWDVASGTRVSAAPIDLGGCLNVVLSPDGGIFACINGYGTLRVIAAPSAEVLFKKEQFGKPGYLGSPTRPCLEDASPGRWGRGPEGVVRPSCSSGNVAEALIGFSPDSRFVIVEPVGEGEAVAFDLQRKTEVSLSGPLRALKRRPEKFDLQGYLSDQTAQVFYILPFAFLTPDLLVFGPEVELGTYPDRTVGDTDWSDRLETARTVTFPAGKAISTAKIRKNLLLIRAADPTLLLAIPYRGELMNDGSMAQARLGNVALNPRNGEMVNCADSALDISADYILFERAAGELALSRRSGGCGAIVGTIRFWR
jgi:hypothetical protein